MCDSVEDDDADNAYRPSPAVGMLSHIIYGIVGGVAVFALIYCLAFKSFTKEKSAPIVEDPALQAPVELRSK